MASQEENAVCVWPDNGEKEIARKGEGERKKRQTLTSLFVPPF